MLVRLGNAIRFSPDYLAFATHYRFEPRPVAVARGNEKGRVERSIRYIRDHFFAARVYTDVADLNAQAKAWNAARDAMPLDTKGTERSGVRLCQTFALSSVPLGSAAMVITRPLGGSRCQVHFTAFAASSITCATACGCEI